MEDSKDLKQEIKELQEANINLRFNSVENQLSEIKTLLEKSINSAERNHELALKNIEDAKTRIGILEEKHRNCPIIMYKTDLKRFALETKFLRYLFKKTWIGVAIITGWIIIVVFLLAVFGPEAIFKLLTLFK